MKQTMHDPQIQPTLEGCLVKVVVWTVIIGALLVFALGICAGIVLASVR